MATNIQENLLLDESYLDIRKGMAYFHYETGQVLDVPFELDFKINSDSGDHWTPPSEEFIIKELIVADDPILETEIGSKSKLKLLKKDERKIEALIENMLHDYMHELREIA